MKNIWNKFRAKFCPKRIYQYGTLGIKAGIGDDRTRLEKICDYVDEWFFEREQRERNERARKSRMFRPYFDISLGIMIDTPTKKSEIEKKRGGQYVSWDEWEKHAKNKEKAREEAHLNKISEQIKYVRKEVQAGRKFTQEAREKREKIFKQYGVR